MGQLMWSWSSLLLWGSLISTSSPLFFFCSVTGVVGGSLGVRQRSVESCGPHPLIALAAASRPFATSASSLNDLVRAVRGDPGTWSEMQILLRRYDDCIRAGDGLHYKRSSSPSSSHSFLFPTGRDQMMIGPAQQFSSSFSTLLLHSTPNSEGDSSSTGVVGNLPEF